MDTRVRFKTSSLTMRQTPLLTYTGRIRGRSSFVMQCYGLWRMTLSTLIAKEGCISPTRPCSPKDWSRIRSRAECVQAKGGVAQPEDGSPQPLIMGGTVPRIEPAMTDYLQKQREILPSPSNHPRAAASPWLFQTLFVNTV